MKHLLLLLYLAYSQVTMAASETEMSDFKQVSDAASYIANERQLAMQEEQKLLWVLGSQWCHDSRSLAQKLKSPELAAILNESYRVSMIDVGYLNAGFEFTELADMKTFYATPTVLILDPVDMVHLNASDMHLFSNAYQVSQTETTNYFKKYQELQHPDKAVYNVQQQRLLQELAEYINTQEMRIRSSYKVIGPLLAEYKAGKTNPNFEPYWNALAKIRMALPEIISKNKAIITDGAGEQALELPELDVLPWEQTD